MAEHTPGPWAAYGTWVSAGEDGSGPLVAECNWDADARLIAAAPDLLALLEHIAESGHRDDCGRFHSLALLERDACDCECYAARDVIAKAKGE